MQKEIWRLYRPGQEIDKQPSEEYIRVAYKALIFVAKSEGVWESLDPLRKDVYESGASDEPSVPFEVVKREAEQRRKQGN